MAKKKILVVEDEPQMLDMIKIRLEAAGYKVFTALDGDEGLKRAKEEKPDLIILDIMMPKKDGYTFVKEAKTEESLKGIPIIVLTAKTGMKDLFGIEGIKDYILKPFESQDLLDKINSYLKE